MSLFDQINNDIKEAMKAREKEKLEAIRGIKKVMLEAKSVKGAGDELSDEEALQIISKLAKQGSDAAAIFKQQGREDLYEQEMAQVAVYEQYLPAKMSDEELSAVVKAIVEEVGATSMKDMGKVMGIASKKLAGQADGKDISAKVKELLS
ncbi:GatB/YqeY domain-containing protein [Maribellus luteus]|uniref:GatB/YqeY domain-containing protein n=1 Tax=Maribellus luteus TaxID=2305463 RepID=A0A399SZV7_9BACT|nr:GatB/YqeY domain-containing protein [Maribellus luteus]RIJ49048.1 GatB/YqeY domain-containing protein [Maribellus luteus]